MATNQPVGKTEQSAVLAQRHYAKGLAVRDKLVAAAVQLIARQGYTGVSLQEVAAAAGLQKNHVLHHFRTKEGLASAVLEAAEQAWRGELLSRVEMYPEPQAAFSYLCTRLAELDQQEWPYARLLAGLLAQRDALPGATAQQLDALTELIMERLRLICREFRHTGMLAQTHKARTYALLLLGLVLGAASLMSGNRTPDTSAYTAVPALLRL